MATFNIIHSATEFVPEAVLDCDSNALTVALTNTAHTATWDELADLTQVSYTNLSSRVLTVSSSSQTSGTYKLVLTDLVLTASGTVGPFRYIYIYDDNSTGDKLLGYLDYGSELTLNNGDTLTLDFSATDGLLQVTIG